MGVEKRGNSYRVQKMFNGKRYSITFDHKPSEREIIKAFANVTEKTHYGKKTFEKAAAEYIDLKRNVLSPRTVKEYTELPKRLSKLFNGLLIDDITQADIQAEINLLSKKLAPKSVRNYHAFISAVLKTFRPNMIINTTLPQKVKYEPNMPTESDVKKVFDYAQGTMYSIPFRLSALGMRRSEICALQKSDLKGNMLTINKAMVQNENKDWVIKKTKTTSSTRTIYIPDELAEDIRNCDEICPMHPNQIYDGLQHIQKKLGIEHFRLHDFRHFYVSYAHSKGMSDADIIASTGHRTDYVMKSVYRHSMEKTKEEKQKLIADDLFS